MKYNPFWMTYRLRFWAARLESQLYRLTPEWQQKTTLKIRELWDQANRYSRGYSNYSNQN
jgi:hypothetical protein